MRNKLKQIIKYMILVMILFIPFIFITQVRADSGWDTSYDSGGSSDSGWSSSDYGSSSDSGSGSPIVSVITFIFLIIIVIVIIYIIKKEEESKVKQEQIRIANIDAKIKELMPGYNSEILNDIFYKKFIEIQNAWMNFDYDKLRELCTDELYNTYKIQLDTLKAKNGQNIMKDFALNDNYIIDIKIENNMYVITAVISVEFYDYVINTINNDITRGSDEEQVYNLYELEFVKAVEKSDGKCPNCGAKIEAVTSTECEYCGSTIVKNASDFVLSKKKLKQ